MTETKHTTQYEVNDNGRDHEYYGDSYIHSFLSFLISLGYDAEQSYQGSSSITISGVKFDTDTKNASRMSKNAFTRETTERKPANRFIRLLWRSTTVIKIHFNKEYEVSKLVAKIDQAIKDENDRQKTWADAKQQNKDNTVAVAMNYLWSDQVKKAIRSITIHQGEIQFSFNSKSSFNLNVIDGTAKGFFHVRLLNTYEEVAYLTDWIKDEAKEFADVCDVIYRTTPIREELVHWARAMYQQNFYIKTMSQEYSPD